VSEQYDGPPARIRLVGRALNGIVARAPWAWPLLRRPMQRYFDAAAPGWDERTGAGSVDHLTPLATAVGELDLEPERILDVGTGTGEAALFLAREYPRASIRGVDISEEMVRVAQAKVGLDPEGRIAFRVADVADLPYEADSFDLLVHVNVPPFFGEVARVLRPGGHVVFVATRGSATPFYTPEPVLERGLARSGIEIVARGTAGRGTYLVGRAGSLI
jgi:ubiquinone/menaquinone biosynthesis C-methylase UbiE